MGPESNVAIIGAGASGCVCAYYLLKSGFDVTLFDYSAPLRTLLVTGGGRCNLAHAEYDFKSLASNYPRGEKFLYSVFSKFSTYDTIALFEDMNIKTYVQADDRIFPISNSAKEVRKTILEQISKAELIQEKIEEIKPAGSGYKLKTSKAEYFFPNVVIAIGGGNVIKGLKHNVIPFRPSLVGLNTDIKTLSGIVLKDVYSYDIQESGDILFTHFGLSGPLIYKISSIKARESFPYKLVFKLYPSEFNLQTLLDKNPHKELKNILSVFFPQRFADYIAGDYAAEKGCNIVGKVRDSIEKRINNFEFNVTGTNRGEETVTSGGYDLNEINSKSMESKIYSNLYFIGETVDIDGFCGGFNLQNAWSTAYVAAESIINNAKK